MKTHTIDHGTSSGNRRFTAVDLNTFADDTYVGHLVVLVDDGAGLPVIALPSAQTDIPFGRLLVGSEDDENVEVGFLENCTNTRLHLKGTCAPGDKLILADPATPADAGKVEVGTSGYIVGIAEESGIDGQLVLTRPVGINL